MTLTIDGLLSEISLPKRYFSNEFVIAEKFGDESTTYLQLLDRCIGDECYDDTQRQLFLQTLETVKTTARDITERLLQIHKAYESADLGCAQAEFDQLIKELETDLFISTVDDRVCLEHNGQKCWTRFRLTPGHRFYRIRPVTNKSDEIEKDCDQLFHISHLKRSFSSNERFSLAGFPSLYLSTMLPLAWQECGYPKKYYYSEYQCECLNASESSSNDELKLLALYSPWDMRSWGMGVQYHSFDLWLEVMARYLKLFPLVLACSFVNQNGGSPFKQEYIIPQMLMQWIQRNSNKIDGVSYFTCVDTSSFLSHWCAYNIAIPAVQPFDKKKYSIKLRKHFCWSKPRFYCVPLVDKSSNEADRQIVYRFLRDLHSVSGIACVSGELRNYLNNLLTITGCFMALLNHASTMDMELALHTLNLLSSACANMGVEQLEQVLDDANSDSGAPTFAENFEQISAQFKDLNARFWNQNSSAVSIKSLIEKYKSTAWNDHPMRSQAIILYCDDAQGADLAKWFHDNHVLYYAQKLVADDKMVDFIREVANATETALSCFWDNLTDDNEWLKMHMSEIKGPIIVKQNDVSIYSQPDIQFYEAVQIGFDEMALSKLFL